MLLGLWVAIGAPVASAPGVQAEEGRALHVTDDTARHLRYTSRAKREADVSLSHRCTMEHPVAPWSTTMRREFHPETNGPPGRGAWRSANQSACGGHAGFCRHDRREPDRHFPHSNALRYLSDDAGMANEGTRARG